MCRVSVPSIRDIAIKKRHKVPILLKSMFELGETDKKYEYELCDCWCYLWICSIGITWQLVRNVVGPLSLRPSK